MSKKGFTLLELMIVIGLGLILFTGASALFGNLQTTTQLNQTSSQLIQALRLAQQKSIVNYLDSSYGIYLDVRNNESDQYILYRGSSYDSRIVNDDLIFELPKTINFSFVDFNLTGDDVDINFSRNQGLPDNSGLINLNQSINNKSISIRVKTNGLIERE